ncbi:small membrane A-kinase anchor protein isoform X1 [Aquila chrysaetos chrysaetos]|uniref:small membrane A-kinase anchor protein isoform X1 n=1 Tax=Aquila chrysaetos chrysaetos TaxID=223781 RepID=UPI001176A82E|nr:small membrane A-kinase anchor protein isoform X1 [Aquila chrysaetos chrysaetos]
MTGAFPAWVISVTPPPPHLIILLLILNGRPHPGAEARRPRCHRGCGGWPGGGGAAGAAAAGRGGAGRQVVAAALLKGTAGPGRPAPPRPAREPAAATAVPRGGRRAPGGAARSGVSGEGGGRGVGGTRARSRGRLRSAARREQPARCSPPGRGSFSARWTGACRWDRVRDVPPRAPAAPAAPVAGGEVLETEENGGAAPAGRRPAGSPEERRRARDPVVKLSVLYWGQVGQLVKSSCVFVVRNELTLTGNT